MPPGASDMGMTKANRWAWLLVLRFLFGCRVLQILLPSFSFMARVQRKDAEQESQMRAEIQDMKQELPVVNKFLSCKNNLDFLEQILTLYFCTTFLNPLH
uniref:Guided entry of tail-anchored proteins factor 1 n=1 Tax=Papio anubis TaxID=9555 RepID=A0A8I5NS05_PAPAN